MADSAGAPAQGEAGPGHCLQKILPELWCRNKGLQEAGEVEAQPLGEAVVLLGPAQPGGGCRRADSVCAVGLGLRRVDPRERGWSGVLGWTRSGVFGDPFSHAHCCHLADEPWQQRLLNSSHVQAVRATGSGPPSALAGRLLTPSSTSHSPPCLPFPLPLVFSLPLIPFGSPPTPPP